MEVPAAGRERWWEVAGAVMVVSEAVSERYGWS